LDLAASVLEGLQVGGGLAGLQGSGVVGWQVGGGLASIQLIKQSEQEVKK
jgi:hypothetical protein